MIFLSNSYVHFYNCHFRSQLLNPCNPFTVYHIIHAFTTLHSFASMDFLPAVLLPFSRTALHMLNMSCSTGIITPCENFPIFPCSLFYVFSHYVPMQRSLLFSLLLSLPSRHLNASVKSFLWIHVVKKQWLQPSITYSLPLGCIHHLYMYRTQVCVCVYVCKNQIIISSDMWNILSYW